MSLFQYEFKLNSTDCLIKLDFNIKKILVFEDPWGRDSTSIPSHIVEFGCVDTDGVFVSKYQKHFEIDTYKEIVFLSNYYAKKVNHPEGERVFFFQTRSSYSMAKEKPNLKIGFGFLVVSIISILFYLFPSSFNVLNALNLSNLLLFIGILSFVLFVVLGALYYSRVKRKGFNVLGTESGIYIYTNNTDYFHRWADFTGKYEMVKFENAFFFELVNQRSIYNKYGSNKINKYLNFVGVNNYEFYFKIICHRILSK